MKKRLGNKISMYEGVHAYLTEHEEIFISIAGMIELRGKLHDKITEIHGKQNEKENVAKGKKEAKEATRENMITQGLAFAAKLFDLGKKSKNIELSAQSDFTRSMLGKLRDPELVNLLETIKTNAASNIQELSAYGITQDKFDSFINSFNVYKAAINSKLSSAAIKVSANKTLTVLFKEADVILRTIDKMMEEFHDTESQFYLGYKNARSIKDLGLRHRPPVENQQRDNHPASVGNVIKEEAEVS